MIKLFTAFIIDNQIKIRNKSIPVKYTHLNNQTLPQINSYKFILFLIKKLRKIKTPYFFIINKDELLIKDPPVPKEGVFCLVGPVVVTGEMFVKNCQGSGNFNCIYDRVKILQILENLPLEHNHVVNVLELLYFVTRLKHGAVYDSSFTTYTTNGKLLSFNKKIDSCVFDFIDRNVKVLAEQLSK